MFPTTRTINDVLPFIANKKEISRIPGPAGSTTLCYQFQDSATFDSPQARECRGIVFDRDGNIAARPLHKFFNLGEHGETADTIDWSTLEQIMDKRDGSMIHTVWLDNKLYLKSKKSYSNVQVEMAWAWLSRAENASILAEATQWAEAGNTVIWELTSPQNRIVVGYPDTQMHLLHIRDNESGEYVHGSTLHYQGLGPVAHRVKAMPAQALACLSDMTGREGYVFQFENGEMLKAKCPWYLQLHRTVSFTRQRDIAEAALEERLDDIKAALASLGHDLAPINAIESTVKTELVSVKAKVDSLLQQALSKGMDRKEFAIHYREHWLFNLLMPAFTGKEIDYKAWYIRNHLKEWSLDPVGPQVADA